MTDRAYYKGEAFLSWIALLSELDGDGAIYWNDRLCPVRRVVEMQFRTVRKAFDAGMLSYAVKGKE